MTAERVSSAARPKALSVWWLFPFILAVVEVGSFATTQSRVVSGDDWKRAGEFVRESFDSERDVAIVAPDWARPLALNALAEAASVAGAGRSDLAGYERVWALTSRGHDPSGLDVRRRPAVEHWFGRVRLRRWDLGASTVRYEFIEHIREAEVHLVQGGLERECPWRRTGFPYGGGVLQGPMVPGERFVCPSHPWLWVGRTVQEDLELQTRECIWQHPQGNEPVRATFRDVPLGERLVFYGGIYHGHEHAKEGGPIYADIRVDGRSLARFTHEDGNGWGRLEVETRPPEEAQKEPNAIGVVTVDVTAPIPHLRTFCWTATIRSGSRSNDIEDGQ